MREAARRVRMVTPAARRVDAIDPAPVERMTLREVADRLGVHFSTVHQAEERAKAKIARALRQWAREEGLL